MIRFVMIVQGEGRGHLTQSLSFMDIMENAGHRCCGVFAGTSSTRSIPVFYYKKIQTDVFLFRSPNFLRDKKNTRYLIILSIILNLLKFPLFIISAWRLNKKIKELKPGLVVNFYEPVTGIWKFLFRSKIPLVSVAHQYFYKHPEFIKTGSRKGWLALNLLHRVTSFRSDRLFAIHLENKVSFNKTVVIPPLLRKEILEDETTLKNHYTVYLLNTGLLEELLSGNKTGQAFRLECFMDQHAGNPAFDFDKENTSIFPINDELFIASLKSSAGLITTAGYEAVAEAMFLGKPVLMVPVKNHFEQQLNAKLFSDFGAAVSRDSFNTVELSIFAGTYKADENFKKWVLRGSSIIPCEIMKVIEKH